MACSSNVSFFFFFWFFKTTFQMSAINRWSACLLSSMELKHIHTMSCKGSTASSRRGLNIDNIYALRPSCLKQKQILEKQYAAHVYLWRETGINIWGDVVMDPSQQNQVIKMQKYWLIVYNIGHFRAYAEMIIITERRSQLFPACVRFSN